MIPLWVTILLFFLGAILGFLAAVFCAASGQANERARTIQQIDEMAEEIIQEAIDHCGCYHRTEGDADYDIDKIGEQKIRKILEDVFFGEG